MNPKCLQTLWYFWIVLDAGPISPHKACRDKNNDSRNDNKNNNVNKYHKYENNKTIM